MHSVSGAVDLFLAVKREMIAVLGNGHGSDEARGSNACSLKRGRQWSDYRRLSVVAAANVFRAHRAASQEPCWLIVELLAELPRSPPHGSLALRAACGWRSQPAPAGFGSSPMRRHSGGAALTSSGSMTVSTTGRCSGRRGRRVTVGC